MALSLGRLRWTRVLDAPGDGAVNMAADHALARTVQEGTAWLRLYSWTGPTLSLGRNEPAARLYELYRAREFGIDVVRRPTGGRAVLHDAELTYAVVVPASDLGGLKETYQRVQRGLVEGLRSLEIDAALAPPTASASRGSGPCFDTPATGEVVVDGRKLVGSAQARIGKAVLQHGSILIDGSQKLVHQLRADRAFRPAGPEPVTLRRLLRRTPTWLEVAGAVSEGLAEAIGVEMADGPMPAAARSSATELVGRYRSREWTLRS